MSITLATAATGSDRGWGHLIALLGAALVFWAGTTAHRRWLTTRDNPSPTAIGGVKNTVKPQVSGDSDSNDSTRAVVVRSSPGLDEFVAARVGRQQPTQIVREAKRLFGKSEASIWRAIRKARGGGSTS